MKQLEECVRQRTWKGYDRAFHIFQSKSINSILSNAKNQMVILFQDLKFMSDDIEYLKRYYMANQSLVRILKLINYYQCNMSPPFPNMIPSNSYAIMNVRKRKIIKLQEVKEQSLARRNQGQGNRPSQVPDNSKQNILQHLQDSRLSQLDSNEQIQCQSFQSDVHDIYESNNIQSRFRQAFSIDYQDSILDIKKIKQTGLIIDFSKIQAPLPDRSNIRTEYQDPRQNVSNNQGNIRPNLNSNYLKISSPDLKTEKKSSFIGYYNSLQKKQTTNILQKYIKSKK